MFKFKPLQYVRIHHFGLDCDGRVIRCIQEAGPNLYGVDYCLNGDIKRGEFYEDELSAKTTLPGGEKGDSETR